MELRPRAAHQSILPEVLRVMLGAEASCWPPSDAASSPLARAGARRGCAARGNGPWRAFGGGPWLAPRNADSMEHLGWARTDHAA